MTLRVVKVGTSLLRGDEKLSTAKVINRYSTHLAASLKRGDGVVLVSSGAVGLGCKRLGLSQRPEDIVSLQAVAAIGQGHLMALYENAMAKQGCKVAQVLLTRSDLNSRRNFSNASSTLRKLLDWKVIPIVNENDSLSPEELRFGDNDTLSALVATAIGADQLIMLTDVDRLYSSDPRMNSMAKPISDVHHPNELIKLEKSAGGGGSWGTGGMTTKLAAARIATASGITVHLADGRDSNVLDNLLKGSRGGTVFHPHPQPLANRKSWLAHAINPLGSLHLDSGACNAIELHGASLLLVGITKVEGDFEANQPVLMLNPKGQEIARGLSSLSSEGLKKHLAEPLGKGKSPIVVHRDVLVVTNRTIKDLNQEN